MLMDGCTGIINGKEQVRRAGWERYCHLAHVLFCHRFSTFVFTQFTRFRKWTRVAVLTESIEHVDGGPVGVRLDGPPLAAKSNLPPSPLNITHTLIEQPTALAPVSEGAQATITSPAEDERSRLRQRLKAAVRGQSLSIG